MPKRLNKIKFIKHQLMPLVKKINPYVIRLVYFHSTSDDDEFINVIYKNNYIRTIDITADSLSAITRDVLEAVE